MNIGRIELYADIFAVNPAKVFKPISEESSIEILVEHFEEMSLLN
jgi:hypothetical protein